MKVGGAVLIVAGAAYLYRDEIKSGAKYLLDHGGKSAAQQDMDDAAGRYQGSKPASSQHEIQAVIRNNPGQKNPDPDDTVVKNPVLTPPQPYERFPGRPED